MNVKIKDIGLAGDVKHELDISVNNHQITVRELIEQRVVQEVQNYNNRVQEDHFKGLIEPSKEDRTINGFQLKKKKRIVAEKQIYIALSGFQKNSYFILINDRQVEQLDDIITLDTDTTINFIKLTPLVGG